MYLKKEAELHLYTKLQDIDHRMTNILPNKNHLKPLSDCSQSGFNKNNGQNIISYCDIDEEELNYFDDYSKENENSIYTQQHCGVYSPQNIIIYKLDKSKYPVFRINILSLHIIINQLFLPLEKIKIPF